MCVSVRKPTGLKRPSVFTLNSPGFSLPGSQPGEDTDGLAYPIGSRQQVKVKTLTNDSRAVRMHEV